MDSGREKLCIVTPGHWSGNYGGAEQQIALLLNALIFQGFYEITYITRYVDNAYKPNGYSIKKVAFNPMTMRVGNILDARSLLSILETIRPHVIYQRVGGAYTGIAAYYARKNSCKMIWHISSDMNVMPFSIDKNKASNVISRFIEKKVLEYGIRNTETIIAQTRFQAEALHKYYGLWPTKIIPNYQLVPGIQEKREQPINIVWISNIKPMKRPELFIRLANEFKSNENVRFIMIGRADKSTWGRQVTEEIQKTANVDYLGEKPQEEVNDILSQSHILVNTSSYEGFPNTFIQAWMREIPVISIEVSPDNVLESNNIGFRSITFENLCHHLELLINDRRRRASMGQAARSYAIANHSEKNIQNIIDIIRV